MSGLSAAGRVGNAVPAGPRHPHGRGRMPTINKTFLLKLLLAVVALGGALAGTHAVQSGRIPDALLRQADRAAAAKNNDAAIHYLRQYLEFRPADVDVQDRLAEMLRDRSGDEARSSLIFLYDKILRA